MIEGIVYRYEVGNETEESWMKPKQIPPEKVVAYIEGCWMRQIKYRLKADKASRRG